MFPFLHKVGQEHPEELGLALAYVIAPQLITGGHPQLRLVTDKRRTKIKKLNLSALDMLWLHIKQYRCRLGGDRKWILIYIRQCCSDPWIQDPGWVKNQDPDPR
jgi:hypothetical protein